MKENPTAESSNTGRDLTRLNNNASKLTQNAVSRDTGDSRSQDPRGRKLVLYKQQTAKSVP